VGAVLVPKLLERGYRVRVLDLYIYGDHVLAPWANKPGLEQVKADIRDQRRVAEALRGSDMVIHLACISNDPSCDLDPELTRSVNYDAFIPFVQMCKNVGIERFVFASSSSVYGLSDDPNVTEEHQRVPVSEYNRYKAKCEDFLAAVDRDQLPWVVIRPATICGYSRRQRLDLTVNILTNHAVNKGQITVFGGSQYRPNLHIEDVTDLYIQLLDVPLSCIAGETFNAGYQNYTVMEMAQIVKGVVEKLRPEKAPLPIVTTKTDDVRSYRISCEKIERVLGFRPKHTIEDAVEDLCVAFSEGKVPNPLTCSLYYNVARMKETGLK
jgi:nucleoside-diphosphate-sugar epimerase